MIFLLSQFFCGGNRMALYLLYFINTIMELGLPKKQTISERFSFSQPRVRMIKKVTMTETLRAQNTSYMQRRKKFSLTPLLLCQRPAPKFKTLKLNHFNSHYSLSFDKWQAKKITNITQKFCQKMKQQFTKQHRLSKQNSWSNDGKVSSLKREMRELNKLKEDVRRAKTNNRLIKEIQNARESKIKVFFDEFQSYVNLMSR